MKSLKKKKKTFTHFELAVTFPYFGTYRSTKHLYICLLIPDKILNSNNSNIK